MSRGLPGALRNRTREKAPAKENARATLEPTSKIITAMTAGRMMRVRIKLRETASPLDACQ